MNASERRSLGVGRRASPGALALFVCTILVAGSVGVACSSGEVVKNPNDAKRDTTMVHEACDTAASGAQKVDVNGDGRPDIIHVMKGGKEVCRVVDLNMDGRNDVFIYYDEAGKERRRESDFDRDGQADEIAILKDGVPQEKLRETNFDSKLDTWDFYEAGRLVRRERDTNGDGIVDQWWDFNNPNDAKCAIVSNDVNQDGKPDPQTAVDLCGPEYGSETAVKPAPSPPSAPSATSSSGTTPAASIAPPPLPPVTAASSFAPSASAAGAKAPATPSASASAPKPATSGKAP